MELMGKSEHMHRRNRGCAVGGVSSVSRPSSANETLAEPGTLIVAIGLIFEVGCAKERVGQ
jgi:hypothetical protein